MATRSLEASVLSGADLDRNDPLGGLADRSGSRRVRTAWRARRRFMLVRWGGTAVGTAAAAFAIVAASTANPDPQVVLSRSFLVPAATLLIAGAALPWIIARLLWLRLKRRNFWAWQ